MNILLLNPPGKKKYIRDNYCSHISKGNYYWPPYDLLALSGILWGQHNVEVIDAIIEDVSVEKCADSILKMNVDVLIFVTGSVSWREDFEFIKKIREQKEIIIFATGDLLLFDGHDIMEENNFLDGIIMDFTSSSILSFLEGKDDVEDLIYRREGRIIQGKRSHKKKFSLQLPRHELFPKTYTLPYAENHPMATVMASFSCPYTCTFCPFENIPYKTREVENLVNEMVYIKSLGFKEIFFRDQTFGANRKEAVKICTEMINKKFNFSWSCETRVDVIDEDILKLMKLSGCHTVMFGVESASNNVLKRYRKGITINKVIDGFDLARKLGIKTLAHFILGLPGEDEGSINDIIKLSKRLKCDYASFNIATPLVGTTFRKEAEEHGWIVQNDDMPDSSCSFPIIETSNLSREKLWEMRSHAIKSFYLNPGYIFNRLIRVRSINQLRMLLIEGLTLVKNLMKNK